MTESLAHAEPSVSPQACYRGLHPQCRCCTPCRAPAASVISFVGANNHSPVWCLRGPAPSAGRIIIHPYPHPPRQQPSTIMVLYSVFLLPYKLSVSLSSEITGPSQSGCDYLLCGRVAASKPLALGMAGREPAQGIGPATPKDYAGSTRLKRTTIRVRPTSG